MYLKMRIPLDFSAGFQTGYPATLQRREEIDGRKITTIVSDKTCEGLFPVLHYPRLSR